MGFRWETYHILPESEWVNLFMEQGKRFVGKFSWIEGEREKGGVREGRRNRYGQRVSCSSIHPSFRPLFYSSDIPRCMYLERTWKGKEREKINKERIEMRWDGKLGYKLLPRSNQVVSKERVMAKEQQWNCIAYMQDRTALVNISFTIPIPFLHQKEFPCSRSCF